MDLHLPWRIEDHFRDYYIRDATGCIVAIVPHCGVKDLRPRARHIAEMIVEAGEGPGHAARSDRPAISPSGHKNMAERISEVARALVDEGEKCPLTFGEYRHSLHAFGIEASVETLTWLHDAHIVEHTKRHGA